MNLWNFLGSLSDRRKLFALVFTLSITAILLSLVIGGWWSIAVISAIVAILYVTKGIWTPEESAKSKIGLVSLWVALVVIGSGQYWTPGVNSLL